jgi:hypothetical protein
MCLYLGYFSINFLDPYGEDLMPDRATEIAGRNRVVGQPVIAEAERKNGSKIKLNVESESITVKKGKILSADTLGTTEMKFTVSCTCTCTTSENGYTNHSLKCIITPNFTITIDVNKIKSKNGENNVNTAYGHELMHRQAMMNQFQNLGLDLNKNNLNKDECDIAKKKNETDGNKNVTEAFIKKFPETLKDSHGKNSHPNVGEPIKIHDAYIPLSIGGTYPGYGR